MAFTGTDAQAADSVRNGKFFDYYGRVLEFDLTTNTVRSFIEGGPYFATSTSQTTGSYPSKHLSNPDGLNFITINAKTYMILQEDLNGTSFNRMPTGAALVCETYLIDMSLTNPTINDLIRLTACAPGAEITGGVAIDSKTILINSQHPALTNTPPYNNSLTYAISNFDGLATSIQDVKNPAAAFTVYPNPASREITLNKVSDIAIYDVAGKRIRVAREVQQLDISDLNSGVYFIRNTQGETIRFVVE
jgi:secreted PhoX family phosphatase